jgi:hypothetical protein
MLAVAITVGPIQDSIAVLAVPIFRLHFADVLQHPPFCRVLISLKLLSCITSHCVIH